jgi:short-subunit dehydrogenase
MNILITGASRGLGRALALAFAEAGHALILTGRDRERLQDVALEITNVDYDLVYGDIRDDATMEALEALAREKGLDILVNNAGVYLGAPVDIVETNLLAPIILTLAVYPGMVERGHGLIVNINSLAGKIFNDQEAVYCASKWGLRGFMGSFKYEARKHGVNVLDVYLGAMKSGASLSRAGCASFIDPDDAAYQIVKLCENTNSSFVSEIEIVRAGR